MTLIDQLIKVYYEEETWCRNKLPIDKIREYYEEIFKKNRIITIVEKGELLGYMESWRVNVLQLFHIARGDDFHIAEEDIGHGNICYVNSIWIREDKRGTDVGKKLKEQFFKNLKGCRFIYGDQNGKNARFYEIGQKR